MPSGDSAVYAHGRRPSDLRPDGGDERGLSGRHGRTSEASSSIIALDWNTQGKLLWEQKSTSIVSSQPARRPQRQQSDGQLRGDAGRRRAQRLRRGHRSARADRDLHRLLRCRHRRQPLDPLPGSGVAGWRQLVRHDADAIRRHDRAERLQSSAAVARRAGPLLSDESGGGGRARGGDGGDALGRDLSPPGIRSCWSVPAASAT